MTRIIPPPRRLLLECGAVLLVHEVLLRLVDFSRVTEKLMASQFNAMDLALILGFFAARFASYFLVPAAVAALLASLLLRRFLP